MKYRVAKIKYQHSIIQGLRDLLENIQNWEEIRSIIPGRINAKGRGMKVNKGIILSFQYETPTGIKCLAKNKSSVQEVFIVSNNKENLIKKINEMI